MSSPYSDSEQTGAFQTYLAQWADELGALSGEVETWAGNKLDLNPNFNFSPAQTALRNALSTFMNTIRTSVTST